MVNHLTLRTINHTDHQKSHHHKQNGAGPPKKNCSSTDTTSTNVSPSQSSSACKDHTCKRVPSHTLGACKDNVPPGISSVGPVSSTSVRPNVALEVLPSSSLTTNFYRVSTLGNIIHFEYEISKGVWTCSLKESSSC